MRNAKVRLPARSLSSFSLRLNSRLDSQPLTDFFHFTVPLVFLSWGRPSLSFLGGVSPGTVRQAMPAALSLVYTRTQQSLLAEGYVGCISSFEGCVISDITT